MACKTCGTRSKTINTQQKTIVDSSPVADFTLLETSQTRVRSGNRNYPITKPLIKMKPPRGYSINILVKGHKHVAQGDTPRQVVLNAIRLYEENGVKMTETNAWLNANVYWLRQLSVKHGYTTSEQLILLANKDEPSSVVKLEDPTPENWGGSAWSFLGAYIASDNFTSEGFFNIVALFKDMLSDPFIGCEECSQHFAEKIDKLTKSLQGKDITAKQSAEFMFKSMNEIRTSQKRINLTWEQAVKKHRWENL